MLKFLNKNDVIHHELEFWISMTSVQGGVQLDVDQVDHDMNERKQETILLTPMDAACFIEETRRTNGFACPQVGHSINGSNATIQVSKMLQGCNGVDWRFVGASSDVFIEVGAICISAPTFVVDAMRLALERMMETLLFPSTGDMEEEFG